MFTKYMEVTNTLPHPTVVRIKRDEKCMIEAIFNPGWERYWFRPGWEIASIDKSDIYIEHEAGVTACIVWSEQ